MITVPCAECFGSGDGPFSPETPDWFPCESCGGLGTNEIPGTALVLVPHQGTDLVTVGYVHERAHMATSFSEGWDAARDSDRFGQYAFPRHPARYDDLRDYLLGYETDLVVACMVALYLTRCHATMYWLSFPMSFYEGEVYDLGRPRRHCPTCGVGVYLKSGETQAVCPWCGGLISRARVLT
jgi:hypothetical protein